MSFQMVQNLERNVSVASVLTLKSPIIINTYNQQMMYTLYSVLFFEYVLYMYLIKTLFLS